MAAARALAGKTRAGAASRPRVAAVLRAPPLGADPPSLAAALQAPRAPPTRTVRPAPAPALLGPRAPPLGGGSPRAAALLGPRVAAALRAPPLGADSPSLAAALQAPRAPPTRAARPALAPALLGPRAPPLGGGSPRAAALLGPRARPLWLGAGARVPCLLRLPATVVCRGLHGVGVEPDKAGHVDGDKSRHAATKSDPEIHPAAVVCRAKPKDVSTRAAAELPCNGDDGSSTSSDVEGAGGIHVEDEVPAAEDVRPHGSSSDVEGAGGIHVEDEVPAAEDVAATRATKTAPEISDAREKDGAGEGKCTDCLSAFKAYSDHNREVTVSKIKKMWEEHSEKQLKQQKSSRMTLTITFCFVNIIQMGIVAMFAVICGVSYAVEEAHDKLVVLSKDEKTREIVNNLLDMVRNYLEEISLIGEAFKKMKSGTAWVIGKIGSGTVWIVGEIGNGAATAWDSLAFWRRLGKKKVNEEDED